MRKIIWIFLNNKLISRDTILPLCLDIINKDPSIKVNLLFSDINSYNLTIADSYFNKFDKNKIKFVLIQKFQLKGAFFFKKLFFLFELIRLALIIRINKSVIIHFNFLSQNKFFKLIFGIKNKTIWIESAPFGVGHGEIMSDKLNEGREIRFPNIYADIIVFFKKGQENKTYNLLNGKKIFYHKPLPKYFTFKRDIIDNLAIKRTKLYDLKKHNNNHLTILFILGYLGQIKLINKQTSTKELLFETLDILKNLKRKVTILIKPHFVTDLTQLDKIMSNYSNLNFTISYSHIFNLLPKSDLVLCNYYSTVLAYAHSLKITTVEYSFYNEKLLKMTKNKSIRPEFVNHFFNNQQKNFKDYLDNFSNKPNKVNYINYEKGYMPLTKLICNEMFKNS